MNRRPLLWVLLVFVLGVVVAMLVPRTLLRSPVGPTAQDKQVEQNEQDEQDEQVENPVVGDRAVDGPTTALAPRKPDAGARASYRVLLSAIWSPSDGYERVSGLVSCLERELGGTVALVQRRTYAEANARIASGDIDIALICTGATGDRAVRQQMDAPYRLKFRRGASYRAVVVVRSADPAGSLDDLKGSSVAWVDVDSLTGYMALRADFEKRGLDLETWFGSGTFTHGHDRSVRAVAVGLVRAASVDEEVLLQSEYRDQVRVLWRSKEFPSPPILARRGRPELRSALDRLATQPACFTALGAVGLEPSAWAVYDDVDLAQP
ncbi:MAG: PhnD/SsuA/transferrin family substrate-binding protein [Oligoflexia bacterium]|nr:PhnD/SsuA/transferrin family substrate-binding protein [Oligoflexia bacterium]